MANDTLTFELGGRVEIGQFHEGVSRFRRLVEALTPGRGVKWVVEDLQPGSAVITLRGESEAPDQVEKIVSDYGNIGKSLETNTPLQYNSQVKRAAERVYNFAGSVEYVRFETPLDDYTFFGNGDVKVERQTRVSVGAVTGKVQTLSNRGSLRFNLYDTVHDKAVSCYLQPSQEDLMREAWGRLVMVSGQVSREAASGLPKVIRQIQDIKILKEVEPGAYRHAKGSIPWQPGDALPEEVVRQLRDG